MTLCKPLTLKLPDKLQPYGLYMYYVVHICDFGMLRVKAKPIIERNFPYRNGNLHQFMNYEYPYHKIILRILGASPRWVKGKLEYR